MNPQWKQYSMLCGASLVFLGIFVTQELVTERRRLGGFTVAAQGGLAQHLMGELDTKKKDTYEDMAGSDGYRDVAEDHTPKVGLEAGDLNYQATPLGQKEVGYEGYGEVPVDHLQTVVYSTTALLSVATIFLAGIATGMDIAGADTHMMQFGIIGCCAVALVILFAYFAYRSEKPKTAWMLAGISAFSAITGGSILTLTSGVEITAQQTAGIEVAAMIGAIVLVGMLWYFMRQAPIKRPGLLANCTAAFGILAITAAFLPHIICGFNNLDMSTQVQTFVNWGLVGSFAFFIVFLGTTFLYTDQLKKFDLTTIGAVVGFLGASVLCAGLGLDLLMPTYPDGTLNTVANHNQSFELMMLIGGAVMALGIIWFFMSMACVQKKPVV